MKLWQGWHNTDLGRSYFHYGLIFIMVHYGSDKRYEHEKKVKRDAHRVRTYMKKDANSRYRSPVDKLSYI